MKLFNVILCTLFCVSSVHPMQEPPEQPLLYFGQQRDNQRIDDLIRQLGRNDYEPFAQNHRPYYQQQPQARECAVCMDDIEINNQNFPHVCWVPNHHNTCRACLQDYIRAARDENRLRLLTCPAQNCNGRINRGHIRIIMGEQAQEILNALDNEEQFVANPNARNCPAPDCNHQFVANPDNPETIHCPNGHPDFCSNCLHEPHEGVCQRARNEQVLEWMNNPDGRGAAQARICIGCEQIVERNGGCNHLTCARCRTEFCYVCLAQWHPDHYDCGRAIDPAVPEHIRQPLIREPRVNHFSTSLIIFSVAAITTIVIVKSKTIKAKAVKFKNWVKAKLGFHVEKKEDETNEQMQQEQLKTAK